MIKVFPLEQLDEITTLEVKHKKETISGFHEIISSNDKVSEQEANNWFNKGISSKEFQYDFIIKNNQCEIVIYLVDWGYTDLIKESGKTTEQACQKAIKKILQKLQTIRLLCTNSLHPTAILHLLNLLIPPYLTLQPTS